MRGLAVLALGAALAACAPRPVPAPADSGGYSVGRLQPRPPAAVACREYAAVRAAPLTVHTETYSPPTARTMVEGDAACAAPRPNPARVRALTRKLRRQAREAPLRPPPIVITAAPTLP